MKEKYCKKCNKKLCNKNITFLCGRCSKIGRKISEEHKQKISKSHIGKKLSDKHKNAISEGNLGKKRTKQQKLNISNSLKGKKFSEEHKHKLHLSHRGKKRIWNSGKNHYNWKGGITKVVVSIRQSLQYKEWIRRIYKRDDYTCQHCGNKSCKGNPVFLEVHHIKAFSKILKEYNITSEENSFLCNELWNISNGILLCINCYKLTNNYGRPKKNKR